MIATALSLPVILPEAILAAGVLVLLLIPLIFLTERPHKGQAPAMMGH